MSTTGDSTAAQYPVCTSCGYRHAQTSAAKCPPPPPTMSVQSQRQRVEALRRPNTDGYTDGWNTALDRVLAALAPEEPRDPFREIRRRLEAGEIGPGSNKRRLHHGCCEESRLAAPIESALAEPSEAPRTLDSEATAQAGLAEPGERELIRQLRNAEAEALHFSPEGAEVYGTLYGRAADALERAARPVDEREPTPTYPDKRPSRAEVLAEAEAIARSLDSPAYPDQYREGARHAAERIRMAGPMGE